MANSHDIKSGQAPNPPNYSGFVVAPKAGVGSYPTPSVIANTPQVAHWTSLHHPERVSPSVTSPTSNARVMRSVLLPTQDRRVPPVG